MSFWLTFCPSSEQKQIEKKTTKLEQSPLLKASIHMVYVMKENGHMISKFTNTGSKQPQFLYFHNIKCKKNYDRKNSYK